MISSKLLEQYKIAGVKKLGTAAIGRESWNWWLEREFDPPLTVRVSQDGEQSMDLVGRYRTRGNWDFAPNVRVYLHRS